MFKSEFMKKLAVVVSLFGGLVLSTTSQAGGSVWDEAKVAYQGVQEIKVYYSPKCGCCKDWLIHLEKHGFNVTGELRTDMNLVKQQLGLPANVASCHTAVIDGYLIEGHVPADDIKRLLKQRPQIKGLSVPQMPVGTPGMEMGERKDPFAVVSFDEAGNIGVFNQYWSY